MSPSGKDYGFPDFPAGHSPLELFDADHYLDAAHAALACLAAIASSGEAGSLAVCAHAVADDGGLHEIVHIALGVEYHDRHDIERVREWLVNITNRVARLARGS